MRKITKIKDPADLYHFEINYRKYQRKAQWSAIIFWIIAGLSTVAIIVLIKNLLQ
jgi:hypothetical protein